MKDDRLDRICQMVRTLKESPTMAVGAGGYTGSANATGPVAGYDPVLAKVDRRNKKQKNYPKEYVCLLYTSPSPRDRQKSRMPSSA